MNKRYYEHTLPIIRGSLSNTYFSNNILTCLSFIFFQIRFLIKIDKKAGKGYGGGDSCAIKKSVQLKSSGGPCTEGRGKSPTRLHAGPKEIWTVPGF